MATEREFGPDARYQTKLVLWIMSILIFLIMPWIFLGLVPDLGWVYVLIFLLANAAWVIPGLVLVPLYYRSVSYLLDEEAIVVRSGVITRTTQTVPYRAITNLDVKRGIFDRLLGLGTIAIHTAGYSQQTGPEAKLAGLRDYERVQANLSAAMRRYRAAPMSATGATEPAEDDATELLRELLSEVRAVRQRLEER